MKQITISMLKAYEEFLRQEERGMATITKYICDVQDFSVWIGEQAVTKDNAAAWKAHLQEAGYAVATVNAKLSALNGFFRFAGWEECRVRLLKVQRRIFCSESRELTVQLRPGADSAVVRTVGADRASTGPGTAGAADGSSLRDRRARVGNPLPYSGSRAAGESGNCAERENSDDFAAGEAVQKAAEICQKAKNRFRRDISHQKRQ